MTPQETREQYLAANASPPVEDMPTVTVQASFDWKFWLATSFVGWILWESFGQTATRPGRGRRA